MLHVLNIFIVA